MARPEALEIGGFMKATDPFWDSVNYFVENQVECLYLFWCWSRAHY
jgi:hypothetical protein